ncbi:MAG: hypothetical protein AB1457_16320 [Chloroflexota bacterium]
MSKGRIISALGGCKYRVAIVRDMRKINERIARLTESIAKCEEALEKLDEELWKAYLAAQSEQERRRIANDFGQRKEAAEITLVAMRQEKTNLQKKEQETQVDLYCADYTADLTGEVGIIELFGDPLNGQVIQPGYMNMAAYDPKRDGIFRHVISIEPKLWFVAFSLGAAWQRWRHKFRGAKILDVQGDKARIEVEKVQDNWLKGMWLSSGLVLGGGIYDSVPIRYMDCNGEVFRPNDRVVIRVEKDVPKEVIGFIDGPRECPSKLIVYAVFVADGSNGLEAGRRYLGKFREQKLVAAYDINRINNAPKDGFLCVYDGQPETNSVLIFCWRYAGEQSGQPYYMPYTIRLPIEWHEWEAGFYMDAANNGDARYYGSNAGGYRISAGIFGWGAPASIIGQLLRQEIGHDDFQVIPAQWTDANGNGYVDPGEVYPPDYKEHCYRVQGIASYDDRIAIGYWEGYDGQAPYSPCDPENQAEGGIFEFICPHYADALQFWGAIPSYMQYQVRKLIDFESYQAFQNILALGGCNGVLYVGQKSTGGGSCTLTAYDTKDGMTVLGIQVFDGYEKLGRIVVNRWRPNVAGDEWRVTVMPYNSGVDHGPLFVLNWITLNVVDVILVPGMIDDGDTASAVAVRSYPANLVTQKINAYRRANGVSEPLAFSGLMGDIEGRHVAWLNETGRVQHEDADGRGPLERFKPYNFWGVQENLALIETGTEEEIINRALEVWDVSPHHKEALIDTKGGAFNMFYMPLNSKWTRVIFGPGRYDPNTGQYSTEETTWEIPPNLVGRLVIVAYTIARY